ncbi:DNA topoisomerase [Paenibacillus alvei]|uniref:DNA topoisomerase n=1 Tax=Paenibacillus alvei TaxID=44250 RepID=A0ABT4H3M4_PAEAL|nr:DNA topoisomerase [Paenibacillus alvei]MCY9763251.1 DNA topoisomerase [Paenibacillus alvei]MCY9769460.1 DNA topoisomerase [Paenibacillus alvei]
MILAEKPDMGHNIADALGLAKKGRHYDTLKNGDVVTWAVGHLIKQKEPDSYSEYKEWKLDNLPFVPDPVLTEIDPSKAEQMEAIKELLEKADQLVLATDSGREGEHIGRTIAAACGYPVHIAGKAKRLWISDLTPDTIRVAYRNMKDASEYNDLAASAQVRADADFWMGITATRFFSVLAKELTGEQVLLSAGRVQTPTLRIVYEREKAIETFISKPFYVVQCTFNTSQGSYLGQWFRQSTDGIISRFETADDANKMVNKVKNKSGCVIRYEEKTVKRLAPKFLDEGSLKSAARKELGFGLKKSTELLQKVYEKRYCTYGRTNSRYLNENAADQLLENLIKLQRKSSYQQLFPEKIESIKHKKRFVDDAKVTEHHAIVVTAMNPDDYKDNPRYKLSADEKKLYELILRHTLAAFHPEGEDLETEVITAVEEETFFSKTTMVKVAGWREILKVKDTEEHEEKEQSTIPQQQIPSLEDGQEVSADKVDLVTGKTSKPKRMADTDLRNAMEFAGNFVDDSQLEEEEFLHLKEHGIGTPATRSNIIETLVRQKYISIEKNLVYLTDKGRNFIEMVLDHPIASIELTGQFERKLNEVAEGKRSAEELRQEFKVFATDILNLKESIGALIKSKMQNSASSLFNHVEEFGSCPVCSHAVIETEKSYSCTGWKEGCKFTIWKEFRKKKLTAKQVRALLEGEEVLLRSIPAAEGKDPYSMIIFLSEGKQEHRWPTDEDMSICDCPKCGKPVVERKSVFACSGRDSGCDVSIWKTYRSIEITARMVKSLLKGKEVLMQGVQKKDSTETYDMYLYLKNGKIESRMPSIEDRTVGSCPTCGKAVIQGEKAYACIGWRDGCTFKIWKDFRSISIDTRKAASLLAGKEVLLKGIPKNDKTGTYDIIIFMKNGNLETRKPSAEDTSIGSCPICKKPVLENEKFYGCSGWRAGCNFRLSKEFLGQNVPLKQFKKLLVRGKTDVIEGFVGKKGTFSTALGYDRENNRYSFVK